MNITSQNHSSPENIAFDKLCMEGNLLKIDEFAKIHKDKLDYVGDKSLKTGIVYRLAKANKIDVLHYLFTTPHISGIPNIYTGPENGQLDYALEIIYKNKEIDFIKYLLTSENIKSNIEPSYVYLPNNKSGKMCAKLSSPCLELFLENNNWDLANYVVNSPDIKEPIEPHFSLIVETLDNIKEKVRIDDEFISRFTKIMHKYLDKNFETLKNMCDLEEISPIPYSVKVKIVDELVKTKHINYELVLNEIDEKSKDQQWVKENQEILSLSKILLKYQIDDRLSKNDSIPKKPKL